jgi:alginate O-acetyltransferase complex protein AlgI
VLFNSVIFLLFLLLFFSIWIFSKKRDNSRWITLCLFSFVFYAWWDWRFLFLIIFSGIVDYVAGLLMQRDPKRRKSWLVISLFMNLGSLSIFKYSGFVASTIDTLCSKVGIESHLYEHIPAFALILPVGISFYTFQSMSYTIDIYRGRLQPIKNIFHFFAYLSMFPQLVAGPIIRAKDMLAQLAKDRKVSLLEFWHGLKLISLGFFQKIVLADNIGEIVNNAFNSPESYTNGPFWWVVTVGFALQIYFDFSGYSLIARGLAKWMGYHFKMNFNHPYLSPSLKEFWQRWHISLSTWFRDYIYIPLGGSRKNVVLSHLFMWTTMIISGIWHGAAFTFIIWGGIHAFFLSFERIGAKLLAKIPKTILYVFTMFQVLLAWLFFRASSVNEAFVIIKKLFDFSEVNMYWIEFENAYYFLMMAIVFEIFYFLTLKISLVRKVYRTNFVQIVELSILILGCLFYRGPEQAFMYFQF